MTSFTPIQILVSTQKYMNLQILLQPISSFGLFRAIIRSKLNSEDYPWSPILTNFNVDDSQPAIVSVQPSIGSIMGSDLVMITLEGFPIISSTDQIHIYFGNLSADLISSLVSDNVNSFISVFSPAHQLGMTHLNVIYVGGQNLSESFTASSFYIFETNGLSLTCIHGCICGLEPRTATLELVASPETRLDTLALESSCSVAIARNKMNTNTTYCRILSYQFGRQQYCIQYLNKICLNVSVVYTAVSQLYFDSSSSISLGLLEFQDIETGFYAAAQVDFNRAPKLVQATFSSRFDSISLLFDQDTTGTDSDCTLLVFVDTLGIDPICRWSEANLFVITLGFNATVLPGDSLTVIAGIESSDGVSKSIKQQFIVCTTPPVVQVPILELTGPSMIGHCDIAIFSATSTSPRSRYSWGCRNNQTLDSILSKMTDGPRVQIAGSLLSIGTVYSLVVKAWTPFGTSSDEYFLDFQVSAFAVPILQLHLSPPPYYRSRVLYGVASAQYSTCDDNPFPLEYSWNIFETGSDPNLQPFVLAYGPQLQVSAGSLRAGSTYQISLTAFNSSYIPIQTIQTVAIEYESVAAIITGGNRYVYRTVTLNASRSYDPNQCDFAVGTFQSQRFCNHSVGLSFSWSCTMTNGNLCRYKNNSLVRFSGLSTLELDVTLFKININSVLQIALTVSNMISSSTASTSLIPTLNPNFGLEVDITQLYSTSNGLALESQNPTNGDAKYTWTVRRLSTGTNLDLSDPNTFPSNFEHMNFVVMINTGWALNNIEAGAVYRISLQLISNSEMGMSWFDFVVSTPPSGGSCDSKPFEGISLTTVFNFVCYGWISDNLPLVYKFSSRPSTIDDPQSPQAMWSPASTPSYFSIVLPYGNFSVSTMIIDYLGFFTVFPVTNISVLNDKETSEGLNIQKLDYIMTSLVGLSQTSQFLSLGDSVASSLKMPSWDCSANACRRLLASSAAYRLAIRKLLLQKLSGGQSTISSITAPAYLRTVKHIATVPSEIDLSSIAAAADQLLKSVSTVKVTDLQSGSLADIVDLGSSLVGAAQPAMGEDPLDSLSTNLLQAILDSSQIFSSVVVPDQKPVDLASSNIKLNVSVSSAQVAEGLSSGGKNSSKRSLNFNTVSLSTAIVKLTPPIVSTDVQESNSQTRVPGFYASQLVGVRISDPNNPAQRQSWSCSTGDGCVQFSISVGQPNTSQPLSVQCNRWNGLSWSESFCRVGGIQRISELNSVKVNCSCNQDGIFKVSVSVYPPSMIWPAPIQSLKLTIRVRPINLLIFVGFVGVALICLALVTLKFPLKKLISITNICYGDKENIHTVFQNIFWPCQDLNSGRSLRQSVFLNLRNPEGELDIQKLDLSYLTHFSDRRNGVKRHQEIDAVYQSLPVPFSRVRTKELSVNTDQTKPGEAGIINSPMSLYTTSGLFTFNNPSLATEMCLICDQYHDQQLFSSPG